MTNETLSLVIAGTLVVLMVILIAVLVAVSRGLGVLASSVRSLRADLAPAMGDIKAVGRNLSAASESLKTTMHRLDLMAEALGCVCADLESGGRAVKNGFDVIKDWLGRWRIFGRSGR